MFKYHQKLHHSQTKASNPATGSEFEYHQKLHHSQTKSSKCWVLELFEYHQKLHHSQTTFAASEDIVSLSTIRNYITLKLMV